MSLNKLCKKKDTMNAIHTPTGACRKINHAVFPVAGLGWRFLPSTKAQPKEMLSIVDKPLIQYAVEEAYNAGILHMVFVAGRNKRAIEDHFDTAYELETELQAHNKHELLEIVRSIQLNGMGCSYVRQPKPTGLGDALLCAKPCIGNHSFAVILADDWVLHPTNALSFATNLKTNDHQNKNQSSSLLSQLLQNYEQFQASVLAVAPQNSDVGCVESFVLNSNNTPIPAQTLGRFIFTPAIFTHLALQKKINTATTRLTPTSSAFTQDLLHDAMVSLLMQENIHAIICDGQHIDCGHPIGFLQATVLSALQHPKLGGNFSRFLKQLRF